ncbi:MAG: ferritin family protein [Desulfobulbaceae bacterium]|nr:ferritin family protein [Desulfobulbaceae bacterium]
MDDFREIIEFAIRSEVEAKEYYLHVAGKTNNEMVKKLFLEFAAEEIQHEQLLANILANNEASLNFKKTQDYKLSETIPDPDMSGKVTMADIIAVAMKREERAMNMYLNLAKDSASEKTKEIFMGLADMERGHKVKLEQAYTDVAYVEAW